MCIGHGIRVAACAFVPFVRGHEMLVIIINSINQNALNIQQCCVRGNTVYLRPLQVDNIFVFIRQVAPVPACWLFKTSATS